MTRSAGHRVSDFRVTLLTRALHAHHHDSDDDDGEHQDDEQRENHDRHVGAPPDISSMPDAKGRSPPRSSASHDTVCAGQRSSSRNRWLMTVEIPSSRIVTP